jgi:hypothetical protein
MNPLLFADWGRMNRLFTKLMWTVAAIMACVVFAVLASAGRSPHPSPVPHGRAQAVTARAAAVPRAIGAPARDAGASR